jgi:hypothetical protein
MVGTLDIVTRNAARLGIDENRKDREPSTHHVIGDCRSVPGPRGSGGGAGAGLAAGTVAAYASRS